MYNASLNLGVVIGAIIDGFIVKYHPWRYIYYTAIALIGALTLIVYVTFPETAYIRNRDARGLVGSSVADEKPTAVDEKADAAVAEDLETQGRLVPTHRERSYWIQSLKLYHGKFTEEPLWNMAIRPVMLLALPPVLWATLVMSVTIGFIVAITSNVSPAFNTAYGFEAWQAGLTFFAGLIGALLGIFLGGHFSDWVADQLTKRNGGIREPEMRLPAITIGLITGPLALALYGCGIKYHLHWIVPTLGIGFSTFLSFPLLFCDPVLTSRPSQLHHHTGNERLARVHYRQLSSNCWRNRCHSAGIQVRVWLSPFVLHKSMGHRGWVQRCLRRNGGYLWSRTSVMGTLFHLGQEDSKGNVELADDEICTMGCGPRSR